MTLLKLTTPPPQIYFILGGARSGKSTFAEQLARRRARDDVLFIATAEALDDEMRARIARHRAERPPAWQTLEAPRDITGAVQQWQTLPRLVILDCLTLWLTNELLADETDIQGRLFCQLDLLTEWARLQSIDLVLVSNEVGMGIVPENALARTYRDLLGRVNARAAAHADQVFLMVAGLPIEVKSQAISLQ
jgi:adenosylcobinamide kinase / adenosylcobinamide-phosphate guanylyltransferase